MSLTTTITVFGAITLLSIATIALAAPSIDNVGTLPWEESGGKTPLLNLKKPQAAAPAAEIANNR